MRGFIVVKFRPNLDRYYKKVTLYYSKSAKETIDD